MDVNQIVDYLLQDQGPVDIDSVLTEFVLGKFIDPETIKRKSTVLNFGRGVKDTWKKSGMTVEQRIAYDKRRKREEEKRKREEEKRKKKLVLVDPKTVNIKKLRSQSAHGSTPAWMKRRFFTTA